MPPRDNRGPRAKNWCFTLNNYTQNDVDRLSSPIDGVVYVVFGREVGANGTPHLQGTICFRDRKRLSQVVAVIPRSHCTVTRLIEQSIAYCKKDGDFVEWGDPPTTNSNRRDNSNESEIEAFKHTVRDEGIYDHNTLRELHSLVWATHERFCIQYIDQNRPRPVQQTHPLRPWQQELNALLLLEPDPRKIHFIVDTAGNAGKSWFARYFCRLHDNAQIVVPGRKADMAYIIKEDSKTLFFDCPRSKQGEFIQYDFLEELKNGVIFSPKYESKMKEFATPHVVVLMNEHPDMSKLSGDRYSVKVLN